MSKNGGPAFPHQTFEYYPSLNKTHAGNAEPGISKLDYFAAASHLQLVDMLRLMPTLILSDKADRATMVEALAALRYDEAAAMLAESERRAKE